MAQPMPDFPTLLSTDATAGILGVSRGTVCNICRSNPGFAVRFAHAYKVPASHVERVIAGERPADIAAEVRAGGALRAA